MKNVELSTRSLIIFVLLFVAPVTLAQFPRFKVLVSLSPDNYPLGLKDIVPDGDLPVVWSNTKYHMIYMNMGYCRGIFSDHTQNSLIIASLRWVIASDPAGDVFER